MIIGEPLGRAALLTKAALAAAKELTKKFTILRMEPMDSTPQAIERILRRYHVEMEVLWRLVNDGGSEGFMALYVLSQP